MSDPLAQKLYDTLPTEPIPNLEEMKITAECRAAWVEQNGIVGTPEQVFELGYRKGRIAGKDAASREILGRK